MFIGLAAGGTVLFIIGFIAMICWICYCKRKWPEWQNEKRKKANRMKEIDMKKRADRELRREDLLRKRAEDE